MNIFLQLVLVGVVILGIVTLVEYYWRRKVAQISFKRLNTAYIFLSDARKAYHEAKFIDDPVDRDFIQFVSKSLYTDCIRILETESNYQYISLLSKSQQKQIEEIRTAPRYELF